MRAILWPEEHDARPGWTGRPALHVQIRVVDDDMQDVPPGEIGARRSSTWLGVVNVPITNQSVVWWNSLHQGPSITMKGSSIDGSMLWPLGLTTLGFALIFGAIVLMLMRADLARIQAEARLRRMTAE